MAMTGCEGASCYSHGYDRMRGSIRGQDKRWCGMLWQGVQGRPDVVATTESYGQSYLQLAIGRVHDSLLLMTHFFIYGQQKLKKRQITGCDPRPDPSPNFAPNPNHSPSFVRGEGGKEGCLGKMWTIGDDCGGVVELMVPWYTRLLTLRWSRSVIDHFLPLSMLTHYVDPPHNA